MKKFILLLIILSKTSSASSLLSEWEDWFGRRPIDYEIVFENVPQDMQTFYLDEFPCKGLVREFNLEEDDFNSLEIICVDFPSHITFAFKYEEEIYRDFKDGKADGVLTCKLSMEDNDPDNRQLTADLNNCKSYKIEIE